MQLAHGCRGICRAGFGHQLITRAQGNDGIVRGVSLFNAIQKSGHDGLRGKLAFTHGAQKFGGGHVADGQGRLLSVYSVAVILREVCRERQSVPAFCG